MMKRTIRRVLAPMMALALAASAFAQIDSAGVDRLVTDALAKFNVAGASVAIVKDGKVVHSKGYGVRSVDTNRPSRKTR